VETPEFRVADPHSYNMKKSISVRFPGFFLETWIRLTTGTILLDSLILTLTFLFLLLEITTTGFASIARPGFMISITGPALLILRKAARVTREHSIRRHLRLEREFVWSATAPENLSAALEPASSFWKSSILVQGARSIGYRPELDTHMRPGLEADLVAAYRALFNPWSPQKATFEWAVMILWGLALAFEGLRTEPLVTIPGYGATWGFFLAVGMVEVVALRWRRLSRRLASLLPDLGVRWMLGRIRETDWTSIRNRSYGRTELVRSRPLGKRSSQRS